MIDLTPINILHWYCCIILGQSIEYIFPTKIQAYMTDCATMKKALAVYDW